MALNSRLENIYECFPDAAFETGLSENKAKELFRHCALERDESSHIALIEIIKKFNLPSSYTARFLDVGSSDSISDFVEYYKKEFPLVNFFYLDKDKRIFNLSEKNKICGDACNMPFRNELFDIAYLGCIIPNGVTKDSPQDKDESYNIVQGAYRVLKNNGVAIFNYITDTVDEPETLSNLLEIGFKKLEHLQRITWYKKEASDTYLARK